jgi:hypothetical protein
MSDHVHWDQVENRGVRVRVIRAGGNRRYFHECWPGCGGAPIDRLNGAAYSLCNRAIGNYRQGGPCQWVPSDFRTGRITQVVKNSTESMRAKFLVGTAIVSVPEEGQP